MRSISSIICSSTARRLSRVYDHEVEMVVFGVADAVEGNFHRILVVVLAIDRDIDPGGKNLQLLYCRRTVHVA